MRSREIGQQLHSLDEALDERKGDIGQWGQADQMRLTTGTSNALTDWQDDDPTLTLLDTHAFSLN